VLALAFSRDGKELLAGGDRYFTVFSTTAAGAMTARRGLFGSTAKVQRVLSAVALSATSGFVMGGSTGALLRLENGSRKVHSTTLLLKYIYANMQSMIADMNINEHTVPMS
jgi:hypothetical protein